MRIKWFSFIRVTGLLLVLLYHFFKTALPGGFIGVDIFFTFSGYLITALLIDEYAKHQAIDIRGFFRRRFYRIVPPVFLTVLLTLPFTLLVRRDFLADIGRQIAATLGFMTNFYEILIGGNYESQFIPHLFIHTWSLAIEVHFYIFWGLLIWFLAKRVQNGKQLRALVFLISSVLFLASFLSMFIAAFLVSNFSTIYFSTFTHIFPFFLGALLASLSGVRETTGAFKRHLATWSGQRVLLAALSSFALLVLLARLLDFTHITTYLFGFLLASLLTGVFIYACRVLNDLTPHHQEPKIINFLSDISYGIYLFHWPFYIIFSQLMSNWLAIFFTLFFSILFAALSFYALEPYLVGKKPYLFGLEINPVPYKKWLYGGFALLTLVNLGLILTAPAVGAFENSLLVDSLYQADNNMNRTHTLAAGDATAISDVTIIGDSVALRASSTFSKLLPDAQLDAAVSRNFTTAYDIFQNHIDNGSLSKTIVLAVGVNSVEGYQDNLQAFIDNLPDGHRLILVTPYNSRDGRIPELRNYELELAKEYDYITLADWYETALAHPEIWTESDGVHYNDSSTEAGSLYVETIQSAIKQAAKNPAKGD